MVGKTLSYRILRPACILLTVLVILLGSACGSGDKSNSASSPASSSDQARQASDKSNPTLSPATSSDKTYQTSVNAVIDTFYNHRKDYNTGLERIGKLVSSAKTESEQRQAIQQAINLLDNSHQLFRQDMDDFSKILPPPKYQDFHILLSSVLRDYVEITAAYTLYYSQNLNLGTQDLQLANHASAQLRTANDNLQRAAYMYAQLTGMK